MPKKYRQILLVVYSLFFVGFATFLIINSFGFRFNPSSRSIENTATIEIRTAPFVSLVQVVGTKTSILTPADLNFSQSGEVNLDISKEDYKSESVKIYYAGGQNLTTSINHLYLLPSKASVTFTAPGQTLQLLNESLILIKKNSELQVVSISFAGITSVQTVQTTVPISTILTSNFVLVGDEIWYDKVLNIVLTRSNDIWKLTSVPSLDLPLESVIANQQYLLMLTSSRNIWLWNYKDSPVFIDSDISGITSIETPRSFWIWKNDWIQKITLTNDIGTQITKRNAQFSSNLLLNQKSSHFKILPVYQGYAILYGTTLIYRPDFRGAPLVTLATDALHFATASDTLYWNSKSELSYTNLRNGVRQTLLNNVPNQVTSLWYDQYWGRLFVYTPSSVWSTWHDNDKENLGIKSYPLTEWLELACNTDIGGGSAVCIKDDKIKTYINRNILF